MLNKKILLCLSLGISTFSFAMQQAPKAGEWPADMPDAWVYEKLFSGDISKDQILTEIRHAYSAEEQKSKLQQHGFYKNGLYIHLEDSKENIIQKFNGKTWFVAKRLRRPLIGHPA